MVALTSNECWEIQSQLNRQGRNLKKNYERFQKILVLFSVFLLLNNITFILAKSVNRPGVRFELPTGLNISPNTEIQSRPSSQRIHYGPPKPPSQQKLAASTTLSGTSFGRLQRILLNINHDRGRDTNLDQSQNIQSSSFENHLDYNDFTFANRRAMPSFFDDAQYLSDDPTRNVSHFDNLTLGNVSSNSSTEEAVGWDDDYNTVIMGIMSVVLGVLILITVIGNVFVIAAILLEKNLQSVANYLIVSLAVADLMVACLVMPLGAVYEISQGWILGPELCDMWTSSDVLCCTASILHLVAIAVDRYWAVTNIDYIHTRNGGRIITMIVIVWSVAMVVSLAPQFGWKDPDYLDRINIQQRCLISQDIGYQIFATFSTFYVPLLVILVLYWKIYQTARKRIRRRRHQRNAVLESCGKQEAPQEKKPGKLSFLTKKRFLRMKASDSKTASEGLAASLVLVEGQSTCSTVDAVEDEATSRRPSNVDGEATTAFTISANHAETPSHLSPDKNSDEATTTNNGSASHPTEPPKPSVSTVKNSLAPVPTQKHHAKRDKVRDLEAKREKKAAKTLAIITGAFVVCWLPFFIMALWMPLCDSCHINPHLASFFLWLGYFNSTLNPVIYTIFSPEFRMAFKRILCGASDARQRGRKLR